MFKSYIDFKKILRLKFLIKVLEWNLSVDKIRLTTEHLTNLSQKQCNEIVSSEKKDQLILSVNEILNTVIIFKDQNKNV